MNLTALDYPNRPLPVKFPYDLRNGDFDESILERAGVLGLVMQSGEALKVSVRSFDGDRFIIFDQDAEWLTAHKSRFPELFSLLDLQSPGLNAVPNKPAALSLVSLSRLVADIRAAKHLAVSQEKQGSSKLPLRQAIQTRQIGLNTGRGGA